MLTWGRESIKDHTTAVLELVKNSYDASATVVQVEIKTDLFADGGPFIRIVDNGVGMSATDVESDWLRLGYSAKRTERFDSRGRRKTGEKGIGRISADRLGAILELRTQAKGVPATGLRVNWNEFEKPGRNLEGVPVHDLPDLSFLVPQPTPWDATKNEFRDTPKALPNSAGRRGTELIVRKLRQPWRSEDVQELRRLLSLLTPPFERVEDFQVRLDTDVDPTCNGVVTSPLIASAAIEAEMSLKANGAITGRLVHRSPSSNRRIETRVDTSFEQLVHPRQKRGQTTVPTEGLEALGPVAVRLLFYPQKAETVRGLDIDLTELRKFLQTNAGVRVYRDGIRVPPYGDQGVPEGDWLALGDRKARNPAGANRDDFRISPIQLVGAVFIGRDENPQLIDTSGREGLITGEALSLLKSFIVGCLTRLEAQYHKLFSASLDAGTPPALSPRSTVDALRVQFRELETTIRRVEDQLPPAATREIGNVVEQLTSTAEKLRQAERSFEELGSQAAVSRTLATIGIASATFGHETQRGLDTMRATLEAAKLLLENGEHPSQVVAELVKAIRESERVSAWGAFALGRVRRDKRVRRIVDVATLIADVLEEIVPALEASSISLSRDLREVRARIFPMDVECVAINYLTNAYYFAKQSSRERRIEVRLRPKIHNSRKGFELAVADSGPGVSKAISDRIWDPLFTTKTDDGGRPIGTGLGLALVSAIVQDAEGSRSVEKDARLRGACFTAWLPDAGG